MTLLNAPEFDERKETRKRNLLIGSGVFVAVMVLLTVGGFLLGHGWLFINLRAEHRVKELLTSAQAQDFGKAYGIWYNDPDWQQHPEKYKDYPLKRFSEDFSSKSDWGGPIASFHVDFSKRDDTGVVVASTVNGKNLTLKVQKSDDTITFFPFELTRGL